MTFEPKYEKVVSATREKIGTTQATIECKLPTNSGVSKVLCVNAKSYIVGSEAVEKQVSFNGFVGFQVIYMDADSNYQSLDYTAEFKDKFSSENDLSGVVSIVNSNIVDIKSNASEDGISVSAIVEINIDGIYSYANNALISVASDNVFTKQENLKYSSYLGIANKKFDLSYDAEIKDAVEKILSVCPSLYIDTITPNSDYLVLNGGVNINVCYLTKDNMIRSTQATFDFNEEIALNGINDSSIIQSSISEIINDIKLTTTLDADSAVLNISLPVLFNGYVFNENNVEIITDLYSDKNLTNLDYLSVEYLSSFSPHDYDEKISGTMEVDENAPFIDEVLGACCNNLIITNSYVSDGLIVEGVANIGVLYFNKEENKTISNIVEMPFSINLDAENIPNGTNVLIKASIGDITVKGRRGKEIEVNAKIFIYAEFYTNLSDAVISKVSVEDEREVDEIALSIYIVKDGDTIWDIAKDFAISPDTLLEQNPELELPIKAGDRIVIYRQRLVEF